MNNKVNEPLSPEEEEVVDFLVELIPVLEEIKIDLDSKGLLDEGFIPSLNQNLPCKKKKN